MHHQSEGQHRPWQELDGHSDHEEGRLRPTVVLGERVYKGKDQGYSGLV